TGSSQSGRRLAAGGAVMNVRRRTVLAGGIGLALAGGALGVAAAQGVRTSRPDSDRFEIRVADDGKLKEHRDKYLDALASKLGVSRDKLEAAVQAAAGEVGDFLLPGPPLLPGIAPAGSAPMGKAVFGFAIALGEPDAAAATALGLTPEQL